MGLVRQETSAGWRPRRDAMVDLVAELCSEQCAGRAPGAPEDLAARAIVREALGSVSLETRESERLWRRTLEDQMA
jgi:hypothetical protein